MEQNTEQFLSGGLVPVLLGDDTDAREVAKNLHRRYGVLSHVFCHKPSMSLRLSIYTKLHTVRFTQGENLLIHALLDFARQLDHADRILCLIPCSSYYESLLQSNHKELEAYYVLTDRKTPSCGEKGESDV
jgi:hypothetical protein